jgi:Pretoxin HINT domain
MKTLRNLAKLLQISLIILLLTLLTTQSAYARGGCFGSGTTILTPNGYKYIEELQKADQIIGYNLTSHHTEKEKIGDIQVINSPDYYLINSTIKVTGTHPFYVQSSTGLSIIEVQNLKLGDRLLGESNALLVISSIKYINKSLTVYNLLSVTPNHNFYASGVLVHNKGGISGGIGGYGSTGVRGSSDTQLIINKKTLPSLILAIMAILAVLLSVAFWTEICNYFRFFGQRFTGDLGLIKFIKTINLKITNFYSSRYSTDNEIWEIIPAQPELDEQAYQDLLSRSDLIDRVSRLFIQYQKDWTMKNFVEMTEYVVEPFYTEQLDICRSGFGENSDIVYQPELLEIVPLGCKQAEDRYIFRVQINAKMVNFKLSPQGFVLSGKTCSRSFTEYWDIAVDLNKKCYLTNISQIDPGAIPLS